MEPREIYEVKIVLGPESQEDLDGQVLSALFEHRGKSNRIGRRELVNQIYKLNLTKEDNIANLHADRQVRESIERLRKTHIILSSSGNGGYWMPESAAEVERYSAEIVSRARKLEQQSRRLLRMAEENFGPQIRLIEA